MKKMETVDGDAPEVIERVRSTRYSVARLYGRVTAYGHTYIYERESDSLIRLDVFRQRKLQPLPTRR